MTRTTERRSQGILALFWVLPEARGEPQVLTLRGSVNGIRYWRETNWIHLVQGHLSLHVDRGGRCVLQTERGWAKSYESMADCFLAQETPAELAVNAQLVVGHEADFLLRG